MVLSLPIDLPTLLGGIWAIGVTAGLILIYRSFSKLTAGTKRERLDEVLAQLVSEFHREQLSHRKLEKEIEVLKQQLPAHLQKIGLVRFNPFVGTGGNQSFSLAILDGEGSGLVITSLHSREGTRLYTKPIKNGKSQSDLSKEEQAALKIAEGQK